MHNLQIDNLHKGYIRVKTVSKTYILSLPDGVLGIKCIHEIYENKIIALCNTVHDDLVKWIELPEYILGWYLNIYNNVP